MGAAARRREPEKEVCCDVEGSGGLAGEVNVPGGSGMDEEVAGRGGETVTAAAAEAFPPRKACSGVVVTWMILRCTGGEICAMSSFFSGYDEALSGAEEVEAAAAEGAKAALS